MILMVLAMMTTETIAKISTMTAPTVEIAFSKSERMVASWLGVRMSYRIKLKDVSASTLDSISSSCCSTESRVDALTSLSLMR